MSSKDKEQILTRREVLTIGAAAAGSLITGGSATPSIAAVGNKLANAEPYKAKDFDKLCSSMNGFSASQIKQHIKLYKDCVSMSNQIHKKISNIDVSKIDTTSSDFRDLLSEQSYAVNGVIYHEIYFGNLGGNGGEPAGDLKAAIQERWGSFSKFREFLKAAGQSTMGWVMVGYNTRGKYIDAYALDLHKVSVYAPANMIPILALDVYEHAYMVDFGIDRDKYLETFMDNIDWKVVARRLSQAKELPANAFPTV